MKKKITAGLLSVGLLLSAGCGGKADNTIASTYAPQTTAAALETKPTIEESTKPKFVYNDISDFQNYVVSMLGEVYSITLDREDEHFMLRPKNEGEIAVFREASQGNPSAKAAVRKILPGTLELSEELYEHFPTWVVVLMDDDMNAVYAAFNGIEIHNTITK